ncbi:hypothetical protein DL1_02740 [Thioclava dalianensis]|uniref:Uncharacterized protein n=2 Tax=Thioclava dalianensis TaxID=1185766 RepID=A0A074TDL6_9RHOB|nr:hypothetical protein DL1_02740 [Thioclava dalianensis]
MRDEADCDSTRETMKYLMLLPPALFGTIGLMLALQMISLNSTIGFRTGRTLGDEAVWYAVNTNVGWGLLLSGFASAVIIWRAFALDLNLTAKCLVSTATLVISAVLAVAVAVGTMS